MRLNRITTFWQVQVWYFCKSSYFFYIPRLQTVTSANCVFVACSIQRKIMKKSLSRISGFSRTTFTAYSMALSDSWQKHCPRSASALSKVGLWKCCITTGQIFSSRIEMYLSVFILPLTGDTVPIP